MDETKADVKQKIRERYKGVSEEVLDVIPAAPMEDFYKPETKKRVAVYARVSTDDPNQTSSYELQKNHYEDMVNRRDNWELVDIYADEGISGTSLQHRDNFVRMISDCRAGKIDIIITKSVSRFARNIMDCIGFVRQLKSFTSPVGVFFETENIFTLNQNSEMSLSFIATLAQEESHSKSEIMNSSVEMRFKRGIFLTPVLLGYDHDENGNLVINEDEADTVRLIFFSYIYGYSTYKIADALTELQRLTKRGNQTWSVSSIIEILTNERYCGDVLARKTYTPNYLDHKAKKNINKRNQYRQKYHHEAIISREDFFAVQKMLRNAKYGNKGYFPEIHVIGSGILKGYVTVHPKWAGFTDKHYHDASDSIYEDGSVTLAKPIEIFVRKGEFNLSGYEMVRSEYMSPYGQMFVTFNSTNIVFNKVSILKMPQVKCVELLVHPKEKKIAVRKAVEGSRYAVQWCRTVYVESSGGESDNGSGNDSVKNSVNRNPRPISGCAFIPTLYKIFGWNTDKSYKIKGTAYKHKDDVIIIYDANNAGMLVAEEEAVKKVLVYPEKWEGTFGESYYKNAAITKSEQEKQEYNDESAASQDSVYRLYDDKVTTQNEAAKQIDSILKKIGVDDG